MRNEETVISDSDSAAIGNGLEIAIIGMSGRFPGADDIQQFWRNLLAGVESLTVLTDKELSAVPAAVRRSPRFVPVSRTLSNWDQFDAAFFGVNPREAAIMDPQHRLFLECSWSALEHAGYDPERYPGAVGVYAGARLNFYLWNVFSNPALVDAAGFQVVQIANEKDYVATRVSYKLNLKGPSFNVQAACSTSLVAVHVACQGLLSGECDMALAGGVAVRIPDLGYLTTESSVGSPEGRIRAFDAKANGTIFSNGMGVVVLKRLADALADGDAIHAVIRGSAVTNDGSHKVGFTAPGIDGQTRVIRTALTVAEVEPDQISYIEAHGTGTPVGDPIEIAALTRAFREKTDKRGFCAVGTVKPNVGHLEAAAGVAGLIKTVLALQHRIIPPSILFEEPNPQIDFESSPFFINTRQREWKANGMPRRAGVSSFGMGGTNAHVIVEEAPEPQSTDPSRPWQLLLLSARTETALANITKNLAAHLEEHPEDDLADIVFTLQVGRKEHEHRRAVLCRDREHALQNLTEPGPEWVFDGFVARRQRQVAFLFSGQGSQYVGMGKGLYDAEVAFREQVDFCCELLQPHLGMDLRALLFAAEDDEAASERLGQTRFTQPALFVVEYALARQWMEWGIVPQAMLGHSIGEYVAACIAGVLSLEDALALVAERGRLMQSLPAGAMLAVPLPEVEVVPLPTADLSLAAVNAPDRCVISGPHAAVESLRARLEARGVAARPLHTSHAFHSRMMEPILVPFTQRFEGIELRPPRIPYLSNLTGTWITEAEATDPAYWARHLRQAVRFADGVRELCRDPNLILLEVGPGQTLASLARQHPDRGRDRVVLTSLRHPKERQEDLPGLLKTLGQLWLAGGNPDWQGFYARERRRRIPLPTYPFERRRFWIEPGDSMGGLYGAAAAADPKKEDIADWFYLPYWKPSLPPSTDGQEGGCWLIFADAEGLAGRVAARLAGAGGTVVTVVPGEGFRALGDGRYEIVPGRREDYDALIEQLKARGKLPDRILHLWNVGAIAIDPESLAAAPDLSFWSLLFFVQSLGRNNVTQPMRMVVASSHMQRVAREDHILPERALLLGPGKIIPQEYPNLRCVSVDIDLPAGEPMVGRLIAEAESEPSGNAVAYRQGRRWVQSYEAVRLEAAAGRSIHLRERGVYLITGGLGGLGLTFAEFLAREYQARLVLVGASSLPDRADWDDWLRSHGEADRISERIRKVREIESLGAEVMVAGADVADRERMLGLVGEARARFGEIHGVIHAAGIAGGGMIQLKAPEVAARVLSPKVAGTRALLDALAGMALDFVVLCSSTTAVAGGLGQVDYCAANNFLDAFASAMALAGGPRTVSINWGAWEEVGMAVAAGLLPARLRQRESGASEQIHPLLDRWVAGTADQSIYETDLSPARHWVLSEHKIMGTPTVPGTTHLELARAAFQHHAATFEGRSLEGGVEIRDVLFLAPLILPQGERNIRVFLTKEADSFAFRVASRIDPVTVDGEPIWQTHAQGRVAALAEPAVREHYDLEDIRARCNARVVEITGPVNRGDRLVYWGPHWQSLKRIHLASSEALALIELPEEFAGETERYGLHPALLDATTSIASLFGKEDYLPISYRKLKVHRPLPRCFYGYLRRHGEAGSTGETIAVDVTILTETGEALVEIEHFTLKRVGEAALTFQRATEAVDAPGTGDGHPETTFPTPAAQAEETVDAETLNGIRPKEGVEALRRVLSRDFDLPQIVVVARDLHALIARVGAINRASIAEAAGVGAQQAPVHARPNIPTAYVAPSTEHERRLAAVWRATLGIEQVGVNDNFFDLGGDSILGIQIVARAGEAGLQLSPDQLFEHQTIAELAKVLGDTSAAPEEVTAVPLPLTSYQRRVITGAPPACWFTAWPLPSEPKAGSDPAVLRRALQAIVARHEALRTRFIRDSEGCWTQAPTASAGELEVRELDLSGAANELHVATLAAQLGAGLDAERGVLVAAAVLKEGEEGPKRALFVAHPAAVDRTSWGLLQEELRLAYQQLAVGGDVSLPSVTGPFHRWLTEISGGSGAPGAVSVRAQAVERALRGGFGNRKSVSVRLSGEETRVLLSEIPDLQRIRVEEVLLAALAETLGRRTGRRPLSLRLEVDAREDDADVADLARTVGCFTVELPVLLTPGVSGDPAEELRSVKEQFRSAVANGARSELLRGLVGGGTGSRPADCEVSLVYLGDAQVVPAGEAGAGAKLEIIAQLDADGLRVDWSASEDAAIDVPAVAADFLDALRALIDFCLSTTMALYTPSDFPDADLSQEELDKLFS